MKNKIKLQFFDNSPNGCLFICESIKDLPFSIKRFYFINQLKNRKDIRGKHAHKKMEQAIFCLSGSFDLHMDDGIKKWKIVMNDPSVGAFLPKKVWHSMTNFSSNCVILVVADDYYDEEDYLRDYQEFLKYIKDA